MAHKRKISYGLVLWVTSDESQQLNQPDDKSLELAFLFLLFLRKDQIEATSYKREWVHAYYQSIQG